MGPVPVEFSASTHWLIVPPPFVTVKFVVAVLFEQPLFEAVIVYVYVPTVPGAVIVLGVVFPLVPFPLHAYVTPLQFAPEHT